MSLNLYRGGVRNWTDAQILEIYIGALLRGEPGVPAPRALPGGRRHGRAFFNRRLFEMHDAIYEPAHTPPFEIRAGAANKTLDQALMDNGYPGAVPVVLSNVHWAVFEVSLGVYVAEDSNW